MDDAQLPIGADLLIECLFRHGIRLIFGMPGSHSTFIYDAIQRHGGIQTILCRNEQSGAFMADGFARATGLPGVICTTAGPGATNALSGIAEAYADSAPVLLLAGQVNHDRIHEESGRYHEIDLTAIFRFCTRFAGTVMSNPQIPEMVDAAFAAIRSGRPGPAAIFLPQNLMAMPAQTPAVANTSALVRPVPNEDVIEQARQLLTKSERPLILAGGGAVWSGAAEAIKSLAEKLQCPVLTTLNGKGIIDERSPISLGHGRSRRARLALGRADLLLAIGCRFNEVFTAGWTMPMPKTLLQIDLDSRQFGLNYPVTLGLTGDARATVQAILCNLPAQTKPWKEAWSKLRTAEQLKPEWLIDTLRREIPDDAVVFADACEMGLRMHTDFPAYAPRTFFYPSNYAGLGWGYPAAVGAAVGQPDRWTVCVSGDGGFQMTAQELAAAVQYKLKLISIVHNDSAYGAIKSIQRGKHESRFRDTDLHNPDFLKFAESFGVSACRACDSTEFAAAIRRSLDRNGPSLIEVPDQWRSLRI